MANVHRQTTVDRCLDRIDPDNGAYITITPDAARLRATTEPVGPLVGLTVAVKDLFNTAGVRTTYGSAVFADHTPEQTAAEVRRLTDLGAVVVGKANLDEFAASMTGHNPHFGTMRIPNAKQSTPSGSSGGSAVAVAEGSADIGLGTDTGGSVRVPAVFCGLYGFKAARDARRSAGSLPLAPTFDSVGYIVRDLDILTHITGVTTLPPPSALRVRNVEDVATPPVPEDAMWTQFAIEVAHTHRRQLEQHRRQYGNLVREMIDRAMDVVESLGVPRAPGTSDARPEPGKEEPSGSTSAPTSAHIDSAASAPTTVHLAQLQRWATLFTDVLQNIDVLIAPVVSTGPPTTDQAVREHLDGPTSAFEKYLDDTTWVNALGWPALALQTDAGPRQIIARPGNEAAIIAVAKSMTVSS